MFTPPGTISLAERLTHIQTEHGDNQTQSHIDAIITAVSTLYGIEIDAGNVTTTIDRLTTLVSDHLRTNVLSETVRQILTKQIQVGDFLNSAPCGKFDLIIANPPYQQLDGGFAASAKPIYNLFWSKPKQLDPEHMVFIIPARWYSCGRALTKYRQEMLQDRCLKVIYNYPCSKQFFDSVDKTHTIVSDLTQLYTWVTRLDHAETVIINNTRLVAIPLAKLQILTHRLYAYLTYRDIPNVDKILSTVI